MKYSNRHLVEVNCGFQFINEMEAWDSIYFGQFYEKIKEKGFTEREERKGVQIRFNGEPKNKLETTISASQIEDQVIFRNLEKSQAILLGKGKISFHWLNNYPGWEVFLNEFINEYFEIYKSLGLGGGERHCSIVYLNQFVKESQFNLSDLFTFISPLDSKFGKETFHTVQRIFESEKNLLITKLNSYLANSYNTINFECGAICREVSAIDWKTQANNTHEPIFDFFESLITDSLRKEL